SVTAFWAHCALMSEVSLLDAGPAVCSMLAGTGFGHAWLAGTAFMLVVVLLSFAGRANDTRFPFAMAAALAGVALARSNGGHPVDAGLFSVPVWIDWLHLLAISVWIGLVLVTAFGVMPRLARMPASERMTGAAFVQSLSDASTCVDRAVRDRRVQRLARRRDARQPVRVDVRADPAAEARARAACRDARRTQPLLRNA
ncbi:hypothetical protein M3626_21635, partial [Psychrobacillus sp. MER TA 17]|nr:hypothetical protein [Psychrobacillus sp. MER TA 17]